MENGNIGFVNAPLTSSEVRVFKKEMKNLISDPLGVAEQVNQFLGPNLYSWTELMSIMNILFTGEERGLIRRAAMSIWECEHPPANGVETGEQKYPNTDPGWESQTLAHRVRMQDLRELMIKGIKEAVPKSQNLKKAFEINQEKDEPPSNFLQRLRDNMRQFSGIDPEDQVGQGVLKIHFVTKAWPDIQKEYRKWKGGVISR